MAKILLTGFQSGLGAALLDELTDDGHDVIGFDRNCQHTDWEIRGDVSNPPDCVGEVDVDILINCAGVNIIDWLENFDPADWDEVMDTNAKGIFMMAKACLPALTRNKGTILNIVSNAAHMPMRCSAAYNASKGAALILTKQLARELIDKGITVFSVSPNKLAGTGMSNDIDNQVVKTRGWTKEQAQEYQLNGLLTGRETDPVQVARFIAYLLRDKKHHEALAGCDLQYGL